MTAAGGHSRGVPPVLYGDPRQKGPYVFRVKFPPNYRVPAHSHSDDRTFTVMSATLYNAYGDKFDETRQVNGTGPANETAICKLSP